MRKRTVMYTAAGGLVALIIAITPGMALAHNGPHNEGEGHSVKESGSTVEHRDTKTPIDDSDSSKTSLQENRKVRLESAKLKVCQAREKHIGRVMERGNARAAKQLELFNTVFERVKKFQAEKNKTVAHYDTLVASVEAAKATATADVAALKTATGFTCDGDNPKGVAGTFKTTLNKTTEDLKIYRATLKDLIKALKSAHGEDR